MREDAYKGRAILRRTYLASGFVYICWRLSARDVIRRCRRSTFAAGAGAAEADDDDDDEAGLLPSMH